MIKYRLKQDVEAIIFDLDGTLWDECSVTAQAWETVLHRHPKLEPAMPLTTDIVRRYMGLTNEELCGIFFPDKTFNDAFEIMMESCDIENEILNKTGGILYEGVPEVLQKLSEKYKLYIVSNAQEGYIDAFLDAHKLRHLFLDYECTGHTGMIKSANIQLLMERNNLKTAVYVGDTSEDEKGAKGAGIPFIYAGYGFGECCRRGRADKYDAKIHNFRELYDVLVTNAET